MECLVVDLSTAVRDRDVFLGHKPFTVCLFVLFCFVSPLNSNINYNQSSKKDLFKNHSCFLFQCQEQKKKGYDIAVFD